jgi:hypothetical protein
MLQKFLDLLPSKIVKKCEYLFGQIKMTIDPNTLTGKHFADRHLFTKIYYFFMKIYIISPLMAGKSAY